MALTPVFLLSAIAALLNVFSTRLGRVADQVDRLSLDLDGTAPKETAGPSGRLAYLKRRSALLDAAVVLGALGGGATCGATLTLFVGALRDAAAASILFLLFGLAILCTMGALGAYLAEMLLASRGMRAQVEEQSEIESGR